MLMDFETRILQEPSFHFPLKVLTPILMPDKTGSLKYTFVWLPATCRSCKGYFNPGDKARIKYDHNGPKYYWHFECWKKQVLARKQFRAAGHERALKKKAEDALKPRHECPRCGKKLWLVPSSGKWRCFKCHVDYTLLKVKPEKTI